MLELSTRTRRDLLLGGSAFGTLLAFGGPLFAGQKGFPKYSGKMPPVLFRPTEYGMMGPWGEVRTVTLNGGVLPFFIQSLDKGGVLDFSGRTIVIQLGNASSGLTITSQGFAIGKAKPTPWKGNVARLIALIKGNKAWTRSAMQMRSAFVSSFAASLAAQKKAQPAKAMRAPFLEAVSDFGKAAICTTTSVTESVTRRVEETIEIVATAEQQYAECFDEAISNRAGACYAVGQTPFVGTSLAAACATSFCGAKTFIDVITGTISVWHDVVDEVTREVVDCVKPLDRYLPNRWNLPDIQLPRIEEPAFLRDIREGMVTAQHILQALQIFRDNLSSSLEFLGPFARCLLDGEWKIDTIPFVSGLGIPFGVEVCISAACARSLALHNIAGEAASAWVGSLSVLASFSPGAAAALASVGIAPIAPLVAALAAVPPAVAIAAMAIASLIIMGLYYSTLVSAQLTALIAVAPDALGDGKVCIKHPTLAVAAIIAMSGGNSPAVLVPPVVTG